MKISNLSEGMVLKNYKELCNVLEITPKKTGSNSYKAQLKEFDRFFLYHKEGHKIIIDKLFDNAKDKLDGRNKGNNNTLSVNIRYMILTLCSKNKSTDEIEVGYSKMFLFRYCNMLNDNYRGTKSNPKIFARYLNVEEICIDECLEYTDNRMSQALRRALNVLTNTNKSLGHRYGYNYILGSTTTHLTADTTIENIIRDVENRIMKDMKISRYDKH